MFKLQVINQGDWILPFSSSFVLLITVWPTHKCRSLLHLPAHLQLAKTTNTSVHLWNDTQKNHPLSLSFSLSRQTLINEWKRDTHWLHLRLVWHFLMTHCHHLWLSALSGKNTSVDVKIFISFSYWIISHILHAYTQDWFRYMQLACLPENTLPWGISKTLSLLVISSSLSLFSRVTDIHESVTAQLNLMM